MATPFQWGNPVTGAANDVTEIKITPTDNNRFVKVDEVHFGYSAAPTGGMLSIIQRNVDDSADEGTLYSVPVTAAGPGPLEFKNPVSTLTAGRKLAVRLSAGGGTVTGTLNVSSMNFAT